MQNKEPSDSSEAKSLLHLTFWTQGPQNEWKRSSEAHIPFVLWERTCCIPGWNVWSLDRPHGVISANAGLQVSVDQWQNNIVASRVSTMLTYDEASLLHCTWDRQEVIGKGSDLSVLAFSFMDASLWGTFPTCSITRFGSQRNQIVKEWVKGQGWSQPLGKQESRSWM